MASVMAFADSHDLFHTDGPWFHLESSDHSHGRRALKLYRAASGWSSHSTYDVLGYQLEPARENVWFLKRNTLDELT